MSKIVQHIKNCISALAVCLITSCEKDFPIHLQSGNPLLVVEAYINDLLPDLNYVILTQSIIQNEVRKDIAVSNATVSITEGTMLNQTLQWDSNTKITLKESIHEGIYTDPLLEENPLVALRGKTGKYYLLHINYEGEEYTATTHILPRIPIQQLSTTQHYTDKNDGVAKAMVTVHFNDPDTIGNTALLFWKDSSNDDKFGWGGMGTEKRITFADDLNNGQRVSLTQSHGFMVKDTVQYYLANVNRKVYNFWDSYNKARKSNGVLTTPVLVEGNITGNNVNGCFSGMAVSTARILVK